MAEIVVGRAVQRRERNMKFMEHTNFLIKPTNVASVSLSHTHAHTGKKYKDFFLEMRKTRAAREMGNGIIRITVCPGILKVFKCPLNVYEICSAAEKDCFPARTSSPPPLTGWVARPTARLNRQIDGVAQHFLAK